MRGGMNRAMSEGAMIDRTPGNRPPHLGERCRTMVSLWDKPEYFFQPARLWHRIGIPFGRRPVCTSVRLPWGVEIETMPGDSLDRLLRRCGVFDLIVTETLWRLATRGSLAIDCGANIGYMSSLLARRLGPTGQVHAFEPDLRVLPVLQRNARRWAAFRELAGVTVHGAAVADRVGTAIFEDSAVESVSGRLVDGASGRSGREAPVTTLDAALAGLIGLRPVSVLKIDAEGAKMQVLRGARQLLSSGQVGNVVFEDHGKYPTPEMRELESLGFALFALSRSFRRVALRAPAEDAKLRKWESPSYLATRDPAKIWAGFARPGWGCLGAKTHQ